MPTRAYLTLATANVGRGVPTATATEGIRRVISQLGGWYPFRRRGLIIGWQEIDEADAPDEHGILHQAVRDSHYARGTRFAGFHTAVPILYSREWDLVDKWVDKISDGVGAGIVGPKGWTPNRYLVGAVLEDHKTGIRVTALDYHLARRHPRLHAWEDGAREVRRLITTRYEPLGHPILATADLNAPVATTRVSATAGREKQYGSGIDSLCVIQGRDATVKRVGTRRKYVRIGVDKHRAVGVQLAVTAKP